MKRFSNCLVLGLVLLNFTTARNLRDKRQSDGDEEDLEDRYNFENQNTWSNRPNRPAQFPNQFGQNQFGQNQNGQNQFGQNQNGQNQFGQNQNNQNGANQFGQNQNGQNQFGQNQNGQNQFGQNQNGQNGQNQIPTQTIQTTTQSSAVQECVRNCLVTAEYNPVCGTNGMTYTNPGRLTCAQGCGVAVNLLRASPCPASTTTAAPVPM